MASNLSPRPGAIPNLCLSIISRNEERSILVTLDSVRDLVNEIVVAIDPTSTDKTWEVVEKWLTEWDSTGDHWILTQGKSVDEVGFGEARNVGLGLVRSEWALVLDSDERFPEDETLPMPGAKGMWFPKQFRSHMALRLALEQLHPNIDMLVLPMVMCDDQGRLQSQFQGERVLRLRDRVCEKCGGKGKDASGESTCEACEGKGKLRPHFKAPVHNYVGGVQLGAACDAAILHNRKHRSAPERHYRANQRLAMSEKFLKARAEENPDDSRSLFYLAGAYAEANRAEEAERYYEQYLKSSATWTHERYQAAVFLSRMIVEQAQRIADQGKRNELYEKARRIAAQYIPDNYSRAELYLLLGQISHELDDYTQALFWYETASRCEFRLDPHFVEAATHTWLPWVHMAACHYALGNTEDAEAALKAAEERAAPEGAIAEVLRLAVTRYKSIRKLAVFINQGDNKFVLPLIEQWRKRYQIGICEREDAVEELLGWCDAAWFEFAGPLLIKATQARHQCRMIVRVHGHEVHAGYIPQVNWKRIDTVIFVADYLQDIAIRQAPDLARQCQVMVIPGGVQCEHFTIAEAKQGNKLAMAGYFNPKKNIGKAVEILWEAKKERPDLELHICGTIQDSRSWLYVGNLIEELGLKAAEVPPGPGPLPTWGEDTGAQHRYDIYFYPWQDDLNAWFADKDYILSTSIEESFHYAVAQGMAAGLKPVIHSWLSSRDFYKLEWIFRTVPEAVAMVLGVPSAADRQAYREYAMEHLSFDTQARAIDHVLARRTVWVPAPDAQAWRFENAVGRSLERMGFAPGLPQNADVVFCLEGTPQALQLPVRNGQKRIMWNAAQIVGKDDLAVARRKMAKGVARNGVVMVAATPGAAKLLNTPHVVYQGGAWEPWQGNGRVPKTVDVGFYGTPNARRKRIIKALGTRLRDEGGHGIQALSSHDLRDLCRFVQGCKIVLNVHWTHHLNTEARVAEVLATGTFLLTEKLAEGHPFPQGLFEEWETEEELYEKAAYYLAHEEEREEMANRGREFVWKEMRVEQQVEKVLELAGVRWAGPQEV